MTNRIECIDFVKCVMILLMISFHIVYIGDTYPDAKAFVYTFHMPCFLIISGYFQNVKKPWPAVMKNTWRLALPYIIMESAYIAGAAMLPIREHIDHLTLWGFIDRLTLHPVGPYWYLQVLIICSILAKLVTVCYDKLDGKISVFTKLLTIGIVFYLCDLLEIVNLHRSFFFLLGLALREYGLQYRNFFRQGGWLSVVVFVALAVLVKNPDGFTLAGFAIIYSVTSTTIYVGDALSSYVPKFYNSCLYIGRNTMPLLLFSPLFTILAKQYQPMLLRIEPTGMLFLVVTLIIAVIGSLAMGRVAKIMKIIR